MYWLQERSAPLVMKSKPYLLNSGVWGYYRVAYDEENWKALIYSLKYELNSDINHLSRARLIDDVMNLARADYNSYEIALDLLLFLKQEDELIPWESAISALSFLHTRMEASR